MEYRMKGWLSSFFSYFDVDDSGAVGSCVAWFSCVSWFSCRTIVGIRFGFFFGPNMIFSITTIGDSNASDVIILNKMAAIMSPKNLKSWKFNRNWVYFLCFFCTANIERRKVIHSQWFVQRRWSVSGHRQRSTAWSACVTSKWHTLAAPMVARAKAIGTNWPVHRSL